MSGAPERAAYIGLGSNLDDPEHHVRTALDDLSRMPATRAGRRSRLFRTPPWGGVSQPPFVNAAAEVWTALEPRPLLDALLAIERRHGRVRNATRWGPRTLDLDILAFGECVVDDADLHIPHPRLAERAFVLLPLADIDENLHVAGVGRVGDLLGRVDTSSCVPID